MHGQQNIKKNDVLEFFNFFSVYYFKKMLIIKLMHGNETCPKRCLNEFFADARSSVVFGIAYTAFCTYSHF